MVMPWSNLPPEICLIVFNHVPSLKTVAECRLVCKAWNPLAERAMVSRPLSFRDKQSAVKFYEHLQKNRSLRYHIRVLYLGGLQHDAFKKVLFKMVMNPNIVSLDGWLNKISLINLVNAVKESGEKCDKLEVLRTRANLQHGGSCYLDAQFYFRTSLRELHLPMDTPYTPTYQNAIDYLDQFSNLRRLILSNSYTTTFFELEAMLRRCQHLESIDFVSFFVDTIWTSKDEMISYVQQSDSLMTIDVDQPRNHHLVEYLIYKYPNMRKVTCSMASSFDPETTSRVLDAVKNVAMIHLKDGYMNSVAQVDRVLSMLKTMNSVVILRPCSIDLTRVRFLLDLKRNKDDNSALCKIRIKKQQFPAIFHRIIKDIASFQNLKVDYADKDILLVGSGAVVEGYATFRRLVDIMSIAVDICFTCAYMSCPSIFVNTLRFTQLQTLKICGANIDQKVFALISKSIPKLKNLTFSSCILNSANPQDYQIDMPHTDIEVLSIISGRSIWESYDDMRNTEAEYTKQGESLDLISDKISIKRNQMVFVKMTCLSSNQAKHYNLKSGNPAIIKAVSKGEHSAYAPGSLNVTIVCNSLGMLKLDLGALLVELKPGDDRYDL